MNNLEELKKKYEELGKEIEALSSKKGKWVPKLNEKYWLVDSVGDVVFAAYYNRDFDKWRIKFDNMFQTEAEAIEYRDYILARAEYIHEFSKEDWESLKLDKWYIYYEWSHKKLSISNDAGCKSIGTLYFKTREQVEKFIYKYKKQILKFEFGVE